MKFRPQIKTRVVLGQSLYTSLQTSVQIGALKITCCSEKRIVISEKGPSKIQ